MNELKKMENIPQLNPNDFTFIQNIGNGSFGLVRLVEHNQTKQKYAAKEERIISKSGLEEKSFKREIQIYSKIDNAAILKLSGYFVTNYKNEERYTLITEYMPKKSVDKKFGYIFNSLSKHVQYIILLGSALGMKYLHSCGIIHRDFKPGNILLDENYYPRICDFGESKISDDELTNILMESEKGTPLYMAPEIMTHEIPYNYKVDVYAFSLFAYQIFTGKRPFYEKNFNRYKLTKEVKKGTRPDLSIIQEEFIREFLSKCWSQKPSERPSFLQIVDILMQEKFRNFFEIKNFEQKKEVEEYLDLFDDELKSPYSKDVLDIKKEADNGNIEAIVRYYEMLYFGIGAKVDKEEAVKYLKKAADMHHFESMYLYARCLRHGMGVPVNKGAAVGYYNMAAKYGNTQAMLNLGHMYYKGDEIPLEKNVAAQYYKMAAQLGNTNGMINYGKMLILGEGIPANKQEGISYIKMAADLGNEQAMLFYSEIISTEKDLSMNEEESIEYLKESARKGHVPAMYEYVMKMFFKNNVDHSDKDFFRYLKICADYGYQQVKTICFEHGIGQNDSEFSNDEAQDIKNDADKGDIFAMYLYGKMLLNGESVPVDKKEAAVYLKKAADQGQSNAMTLYGQMLLNGDGIPYDKKTGFKYLKYSIERTDLKAMYLYGQIFRNGEGIPIDKVEGSRYLKMASDRRYHPAMFAYGQMLLKGEGIPMNKEKGLDLIFQSTNLDTHHQYLCGEMFRNGDGVPVDKKKAETFLKKAADFGDADAMISYGIMLFNGEGILKNINEGMRYILKAADIGNVEGMKLYAGILINYKRMNEASICIKKAADKKDLFSFMLYKYVFRRYNKTNEDIIENEDSDDEKEVNDEPVIKVNMYKNYIWENNNFFYLLKSTIPQAICDEFRAKIGKLKCFSHVEDNVIHNNDPNSLCIIYHLKNNNDLQAINHVIDQVMNKHYHTIHVEWCVDMFFDERMIPSDVLELLLDHLERIKESHFILNILRNIFDGRQIASYIHILPFFFSKRINQSIHDLLLPRGMVFDKEKYPLISDIVINEDMLLKNKNDFDLIVEEIKSTGIVPINIERDRLYLYGDYVIRKLFQRFSFICFNDEVDKMLAVNHVNSIVYKNKKNVLQYDYDLHYASFDEGAFPKIVRDNFDNIFGNIKGIKDIQKNVHSIEFTIVRTFIGFDSVEHLKKCFYYFFHYVDIYMKSPSPKLFCKKKNLCYIYFEGSLDAKLENEIKKNYASDIQKNCTEFNGERFYQYKTRFMDLTFIGFNSFDIGFQACTLIKKSSGINFKEYTGKKTFVGSISDIPEQYLYYDSL